MLMRETAQGDSCTDTVRESALKVDSGRTVPCRTGDWNPHQYCFWLQSNALPTELFPNTNPSPEPLFEHEPVTTIFNPINHLCEKMV